jgi:glycosyltransferase involved in cell wall biosynthesis
MTVMQTSGAPAPDERPDLSIVIPVLDEEENVAQVYRELAGVLRSLGRTYEIIFVDDGSSDDTYREIRKIDDPRVIAIGFKRHRGKAAALSCGFSEARGDVIITMDGDLQDDPAEIPRFLAALAGYDVVSGWKQGRQDSLDKTLPSRAFNWLTRRLTGVQIHDFNCGFKAYRRAVVKNIDIYGELHRYIPAIARWKGYDVGEITVAHRPRVKGRSKYGMKRLPKGLLDLITIKFLMSYGQRPLHFFGGLGLLAGGIGTIICLDLLYSWLGGNKIGERPLLILGVLLILVGMQFIATGLIGELIISRRSTEEWVRRD